MTEPEQQPAWTREDLTNPHAVGDKARRVERMFAAIAPSYDLNNRVHSLGRDQAWRRAAVRMAGLGGGERVVDVACGTGDLTLAFADGGAGQVLGMDFTEPMLGIARAKSAGRAGVSYQAADAMRLPVADGSVDVVSIAFGIRNVTDPQRAMGEFARVLRPGGRLVILEFSLPRHALLRAGYDFYFKHVMPRTAKLVARDRSGAYDYLPQSVSTFIDREQMVRLMEQAGFESVQQRALTFGIAICYAGRRSGQGVGMESEGGR